MITDCQPDTQRLAAFHDCMTTYDVEGDDPDFVWNILSLRMCMYSCGAIYREGEDDTVHNHSPEEFALCQRLSAEAAKIMEGTPIGMGSAGMDYFSPFFLVASADAPLMDTITAEGIRSLFSGAIYPPTRIWTEPLIAQGDWWNGEFGAVPDDLEPEEVEEGTRPWQSLVDWFANNPTLHNASFVAIGEENMDDDNGGSVFPRLFVALTKAGSLVGISSYVVYA